MNRIALAEAIELLKTNTPVPLITLDEIHLDSEKDEGEDFNFWVDGYLVVKHPQSGEIYSRFYVDVEIKSDNEVLIDFDTAPFEMRTEGLEILDATGKIIVKDLETVDELASFSTVFCPDEAMDSTALEALKTAFKAQLAHKLGGQLSIESVQQHEGLLKADRLQLKSKPSKLAESNRFMVRTDHILTVNAQSTVGFERYYLLHTATAEQANIAVNKMLLKGFPDFEEFPDCFFSSLYNFDWIDAKDSELNQEQLTVKNLLNQYVNKHDCLPIDDDHNIILNTGVDERVYSYSAEIIKDDEYAKWSERINFTEV